MPLVADRVKELTSTTGTGTLTLTGAGAGFRTFGSAFSNGVDVYYAIVGNSTDWEVGVGTYTTNTLTRNTVYASSNAGAKIVIASGNTEVFNTLPADAITAFITASSADTLTNKLINGTGNTVVNSSISEYLNTVSGADTITASANANYNAYTTGQSFSFVAVGDNTTAVTININALGAKSIYKKGTTALVAGDIVTGALVNIVYNGTAFQLNNSSINATGISTFLANPTSANLLAAVTDETGSSGALVFATSPVLTTPNLGTPSTLVGTNISGTAANLTAGVATVANGIKTATTTVSVSAATAPNANDVLTATNSTTATWKPVSTAGANLYLAALCRAL